MQEKIPDLKQFRKESNRHVLVLEAQVSEQDKYKLIHLSNNVLRTAGNDLTGVMKKNYDQLVRTKRYRHLQFLDGKAKKAGREKEQKCRNEADAGGISRDMGVLPPVHDKDK